MGRQMQIRPARVWEAVTKEIQAGPKLGGRYAREVPPWYDIVHKIPPSETLTRTVPAQHALPNPLAKMTRPKRTFVPKRIRFPEDDLRKTFFRDHPWELARPRLILETDGRDSQRYDWSKGLRQPGLPLCGECVVQRQMWLMENEGMAKNQAYDKARKEFYDLRHEEQVEQRIAREEALHTGAYFGKTRLQISTELENEVFEDWKEWAGLQLAAAQAAQERVASVAPAIGTTPGP